MKDHVKYARARDQLYHLRVAFRRLDNEIPKPRRTPELRQVLDTVHTVLDQACDAFERGHILEVLVNQYIPTPLPGFEEFVAKARQATKDDLPLTDDEREALRISQDEFFQQLSQDDPFDGAGDFEPGGCKSEDNNSRGIDWEDYNSPPPDADEM